MNINLLNYNALVSLKSSISENIDRYRENDVWIDDFFANSGDLNYFYFSGIITPDEIVLRSGGNKDDAVNAITLYEGLKGFINPAQASDLRLWAYLAHKTFWEYMRNRWPIENQDELDDSSDVSETNKIINRINSRYFFGNSVGKGFARQGIARLFWGAYLTVDEISKENQYELTEYLFSKQDIFASVLERELARNHNLILEALRVLKAHPSLKREEIRRFFILLNQAGGTIVLDSLQKGQCVDLVKRILDKCVK